MMRIVLTRVLVILGLLGAAASALAPPAHAAPPTRIVDQTADVACTGVTQDVKITVRVTRSDLAGTESSVQLSVPGRETIGGGQSTSDWGDGTFRAAIPVLDLEEPPRPAGEVYFSGSYTPTGEPQLTRDRFNVGNVRVVEEHSETLLAVSDVTLTYDDNDTFPGDITFTDLTCDGSLVEGSLFFTNPATLVEFGSDLFHECTTSNVVEDGLTIEGTIDELFVDVTYADRPEANASGLVVADGGRWQGEFRLQISDEPAGTVTATATLERGRPFHATEGDTGMRTHFQVTPYHFTLAIQGPDAPAELDCTLFQVRQKLHQPNPSG